MCGKIASRQPLLPRVPLGARSSSRRATITTRLLLMPWQKAIAIEIASSFANMVATAFATAKALPNAIALIAVCDGIRSCSLPLQRGCIRDCDGLQSRTQLWSRSRPKSGPRMSVEIHFDCEPLVRLLCRRRTRGAGRPRRPSPPLPPPRRRRAITGQERESHTRDWCCSWAHWKFVIDCQSLAGQRRRRWAAASAPV
jgi:hypothetical protein